MILTPIGFAIAGLLFGLVFPRLMKELDVDVYKEHSLFSIIAFAFLIFFSYLTFPIFGFGTLSINDVSTLYGSPLFWFIVSLIIGGLINFFILRVKKE